MELNITDFNILCSEFMFPNAREEYERGDALEINFEDGFFKKGLHIFGRYHMMKYHSDWNWIFDVIEKIKSLDDSSRYYKWEQDGEIKNNFIKYSIMIVDQSCYIDAEFELDPPKTIATHTCPDIKEATVMAIYKFLKWREEWISKS